MYKYKGPNFRELYFGEFLLYKIISTALGEKIVSCIHWSDAQNNHAWQWEITKEQTRPYSPGKTLPNVN